MMINSDNNVAHKVVFNTAFYQIDFDLVKAYCRIFANNSHKVLFEFAIDSTINALNQVDQTSSVELVNYEDRGKTATVEFKLSGNIWQSKKLQFELLEDHILLQIKIQGNGQRIDTLNYLLNNNNHPNTTEFNEVYVPRFDWMESQVIINSNQSDSLSCQQWLSPPPFAYAFLSPQESIFCGIAAQKGTYNFLSFDYTGHPAFTLTYEGHTVVNGTFESPKLVIGFGATEKNQSIGAYIQWLRQNSYLEREPEKVIPDKWREPIFCGWGEMRYDYRQDHDGHENGNFVNVTDYCHENLYRGYIKTLETNGVHPGTIIIDMGWAKKPALHQPDPQKWVNLRAFIDEEHAKGRQVLLWYTPVVTAGLPITACMTLHGRAVCPDPTSPVYQKILADEIRHMISGEAGCLDADGFKIDFTQNTPSESGRFTTYINTFWGLINENNSDHLYPPLAKRTELIKTHGPKWGVEILKEYISLIYTAMKRVKSDSMLITHTANPYFAEVVDVLRLNDLDGECENVLGVMENRAVIARMCSKNWLLDTDNDLMYNKDRWCAYIKFQPEIGIPDTYYARAIATSGETFDQNDYALLRQTWETYRRKLKSPLQFMTQRT